MRAPARSALNRPSHQALVHHIGPVLGHGAEEPRAARFERLVGDLDVEQKRDAAALEAELANLMGRHGPETDDARLESERAAPLVLQNIRHDLAIAAPDPLQL